MHAALQERAEQRGLRLLSEPQEVVDVLPGRIRVRITLTVQAAPRP